MSGACVYFITDGTYTKIGTTTDLKQRLTTLQTSNPNVLKVVLTLPGGVELESRLHEVFGHKRRQREWFELSSQDLEWVRQQALVPEPVSLPELPAWSEEVIASLSTGYAHGPLRFDSVRGSETWLLLTGDNVRETTGPVPRIEIVDATGRNVGDARRVKPAGVRGVLHALAQAESVQETCELLLQAALLDWRNALRSQRRTDWLYVTLCERQGERWASRRPDLVTDRALTQVGSLYRPNTSFLPLGSVADFLLDAGVGDFTVPVGLQIVHTVYARLAAHVILLGGGE